MSLFKNIEAVNKRVEARSTKRRNFINQLLNGEQDDNEFQALIASRDAALVPQEPVDLATAPPGSVNGASLSNAVAARVGSGKHSMNDGHGHSSSAEVKGLNADFNARLQRLIKDSGGKIKVNSGYRSNERQAQLYAEAVKKHGKNARKWAAPPGKSKHNHGLAADLGYSPGGREFAHANAAKYGLAFPMDHEPWHIEPISARKKK